MKDTFFSRRVEGARAPVYTATTMSTAKSNVEDWAMQGRELVVNWTAICDGPPPETGGNEVVNHP
jgi:hypothetical protein